MTTVTVKNCIRECPLAQHHLKSNTFVCNHPNGWKVFALQHTGIPVDCPLNNSSITIQHETTTDSR